MHHTVYVYADKIMVVVHMGDYIEVDKYYKKTNTRNPNEDLKEKWYVSAHKSCGDIGGSGTRIWKNPPQ